MNCKMQLNMTWQLTGLVSTGAKKKKKIHKIFYFESMTQREEEEAAPSLKPNTHLMYTLTDHIRMN